MAKRQVAGEREQKLARLVSAFRQTYAMTIAGIESIAGICKEAHELDPNFGQRLRDNGIQVSDGFLASLLKVANRELYAGILLQSRGLLRLRKVSWDDQVALCTTGVLVYTPDKPLGTKLPLSKLTNDQVTMVVTTQGRIRSVKEQQEWKDTPPKTKTKTVDHTFTITGIRFYNFKVWSIAELETLIKEWKKTHERVAQR